jgi:Uma2 family endonuclease
LLAQAMPGGELRFSPSDVYLDDFNVVQPDLFWVSPDKSLCKLGEDGYWHGAPDLVIEIFSEGTVLRDRREKFLLYQKFGTREYWMVDPAGKYIEVWRLHGKELRRDGLFGAEDTFESAALGGVKIEVEQVF